MGRPKQYTTPAARQAAYRQRWQAEMVAVNRMSLEAWEARLARLCAAIVQAANADDPLACHLLRTHEADTLDALTVWFAGRRKEESIEDN